MGNCLSLEESIVRTMKECGGAWFEVIHNNPGFLFDKMEDVYEWYKVLPNKCEYWDRCELVTLDRMLPDLMYALSVLHVCRNVPLGGNPFDTQYQGRLKQESLEMVNMVYYLLERLSED